MTDLRRSILLTCCALMCAARAHAANELCGQTITQSVTFAADQSCTGTGLIVGADGITIDLAGFTLAGNQTSNHHGIELNGHSGTTIKNGTIRNFDIGIHYFSTCIDNITMSNLVVRDSIESGVSIASVSSWTIDHSAFLDNSSAGAGITMFCDSGTGTVTSSAFVGNDGNGLGVATSPGVTLTVTKVLANRNGFIGVALSASSGTTMTVQSSTAAGNGADGIVVDDEFAHDDVTKLTKNAVIGNHLDGIDLVGVPAAAVSGNVIAGNGAIGIEVSQSNGILATKNRVLGNTGDGITIDANSASALIKGNTVVGNDGDGILTANATAILAKNVANANDGQGILATDGAVDGKGNTARANASLVQCSPAVTCPPAFVAKSGPVMPTCGMHVGASIKLGGDSPLCASMPGLIVDADGVTIDLNGHRLQGDRTAGNIGIDLGGHSHVTIKNGIVQGFDKGIYAATDTGVKLVNVEVRDSLGDGAALSGSSGFTVTKSVFVSNGGNGLTLGDGTHDVKVSGTFAVANGGDGVAVRALNTTLTNITSTANAANGITVIPAASTATIQSSTVAGNQQDGIRADADQVAVSKTTVAGNLLDGVETRSSGAGVTLAGNVADGNGGDGLGIHELSQANAMTKNTAIGNGGNGLFVDSVVGATTVTGNTADGNADGITVESATTTVAKNVADGNLDMGIDAPSGAIDGGGNKARHNGGAADCSPAIACQ